MIKNNDVYKVLLIILLLFCILIFTGQAFASLPAEISIPSTWSPNGTRNYNILGNTYISHEYNVGFDPEYDFYGDVCVVTKLSNPSDLESEIVITDEDELRAVTNYALWKNSNSLNDWYSSSRWLQEKDHFIEMHETVYNPNNEDIVNGLFWMSNFLFNVTGLVYSGGISGVSTLSLGYFGLKLGLDTLDFVEASCSRPDENGLKYAIQAIADMDPDERAALENQIGSIEDYITRGSTYDIIGSANEAETEARLLLTLSKLSTTGIEIINDIKAAIDPILVETSYGQVALNSAVSLAVGSGCLLAIDLVLFEGIEDINVWFTQCMKQGNLHSGVGVVICQSIADDLDELETITDPIQFELKLALIIRKIIYYHAIYYELVANVSNYAHLINDDFVGNLAIKDSDLDILDDNLSNFEDYFDNALKGSIGIAEVYNYLIEKGINSYGISILPSGGDPSCTTTTTWGVFGQVVDGNGDGVSGATVNVFLSGYSQSWGSDTTDSNGNYSISNISAPAKGSYTITIEATSGGATGTNSSQTLEVTKVEEGHDLSLEGVNGGFSVDPMSITPGGACNLIVERITNKGEYPEDFDLIFELKYPNGSLCASKSKHLSLNAGISLTNQSETLFSDSSESGNYIAMVRIDCPNDTNPEDNQRSLSVYVGQIQNYTQYKGDYVCCDIDNPIMTYGIYKLNVLFITDDYFRADVLINDALLEPLVRFNPGEPHYYLGGNLLIFCNITDSSSQYACAFIGEPNEPNPFNYTPSTPHFSQGTTGILKVECPTGSEFRNFSDLDIILTDDVSTVRGWYDRETFVNDWEVNRKFNIPASQATGTYTVWFSESLVGGDYVYLKKLDFVIEKGHDAFVNSISTKVDGVEKTEFDIGENVSITANVGVSGGYTEEVNVVLSITGPNGYSYPDSKDRIESKATIGSTSQDIIFNPWNTSGLVPGNYTISVTANMGEDINSGNNTKTKAIVIKELPALIVDGQTDKATYDQGEQIELTATVTDPNSNPVDDATVTATITWPDLTESNPALSYNTMSDKYEYYFNATQFGDYTIELRAVKTNYGTGTKELPLVTVNNTPPDTVINNVVPSEGQTINSNSVSFSWTGSDFGTPVHHLAYSWKLDESTYSDFSTNTIIELNELSDGPHTFYVKAFDGVLEDSTPAQRSFIVNTSEPPEVYLSKTANKATVTSGEVVTYTITYDNDGAGPAKNAIIEDVIPANTTYVAASASSGNSIHIGNVVVEVKVNATWEADSASPSGEVTAVRWIFDSDIAVDDDDNYGTAEDESPNTNDTDAGTVTLQVTIE